MARASSKVIDFTNVKDRGQFNTKPVPAGDYLAKIVNVEDGESKSDKTFQYIFTIKLSKFSQNSYPYYCKLQENQLWKLRNILIAAGMTVPKKRLKLDPAKTIGKTIGVTMEDDEYEGRTKSEVSAVFPASELGDDVLPNGADGEDDEADYNYPDEDESEADDADEPEVEDSEEEDEEEAEEEEDAEVEADAYSSMDRTQLKRAIKKMDPAYSVKRTQSDDDLREVARGLEDAASENDDDDLDELDIEDLD